LEKLDFETAASEKEKLEQHQREEQKARMADWVPKFFDVGNTS
jgi:hypothetical protein